VNVKEFSYCPYCGRAIVAATCQSCGRRFYSAPHPNVSGVICDPVARQLLLVKEAKPGVEHQAGWEIPGGFVDVLAASPALGESLEAALQREMVEELGSANAHALLGRWSYLASFGATYRDGTALVTVYFVATIPREMLALSADGQTLMRWCDLQDLPSFQYSCDRQAAYLAAAKVSAD
jgi:ADP-ribose pyrophosphatase YjhB (NUDIX family)